MTVKDVFGVLAKIKISSVIFVWGIVVLVGVVAGLIVALISLFAQSPVTALFLLFVFFGVPAAVYSLNKIIAKFVP
jgi:hypothetical protein